MILLSLLFSAGGESHAHSRLNTRRGWSSFKTFTMPWSKRSRVHSIWEELSGQELVPPGDKPLTLVAYESALTMRAYVEPVAVAAPVVGGE